jgi:hypothetical protein
MLGKTLNFSISVSWPRRNRAGLKTLLAMPQKMNRILQVEEDTVLI